MYIWGRIFLKKFICKKHLQIIEIRTLVKTKYLNICDNKINSWCVLFKYIITFILTVQVYFKEEHLIQKAKKKVQKINVPYVYGKYEPKCVYLSTECEVSHVIGPLTRLCAVFKLSAQPFYVKEAHWSFCSKLKLMFIYMVFWNLVMIPWSSHFMHSKQTIKNDLIRYQFVSFYHQYTSTLKHSLQI